MRLLIAAAVAATSVALAAPARAGCTLTDTRCRLDCVRDRLAQYELGDVPRLAC